MDPIEALRKRMAELEQRRADMEQRQANEGADGAERYTHGADLPSSFFPFTATKTVPVPLRYGRSR